MPPPLLWPFPWWTAAIVVFLVTIMPCLIAFVRVRRRNKCIGQLAIALRDSGMHIGPDLFAIGEGKNVMVVNDDRIAVTDVKNWRVVQMLTWDQLAALKIYHNGLDQIEFRLVINGGAQTRKIGTYSIVGFGRLFIQSAREGKPVEYIQR